MVPIMLMGNCWVNPLHPQRLELLPLWLRAHRPLQIFWVIQSSSIYSFGGYKQIPLTQQKTLLRLRAGPAKYSGVSSLFSP